MNIQNITGSVPFGQKTVVMLKAALVVLSMSGMALAAEKPRDFFAAKGVVAGKAEATKEGAIRIPIKFETEIIHSGQWLDKVKTSVDGKSIHITADFTSARKTRYPGYIETKDLAKGEYSLKYRDPNGKVHFITKITVP